MRWRASIPDRSRAESRVIQKEQAEHAHRASALAEQTPVTIGYSPASSGRWVVGVYYHHFISILQKTHMRLGAFKELACGHNTHPLREDSNTYRLQTTPQLPGKLGTSK